MSHRVLETGPLGQSHSPPPTQVLVGKGRAPCPRGTLPLPLSPDHPPISLSRCLTWPQGGEKESLSCARCRGKTWSCSPLGQVCPKAWSAGLGGTQRDLRACQLEAAGVWCPPSLNILVQEGGWAGKKWRRSTVVGDRWALKVRTPTLCVIVKRPRGLGESQSPSL